MTPKQRVLKRWPKAYVTEEFNPFLGKGRLCIMCGTKKYETLGTGSTPAAAWRNAAERMGK